MRRFLLALATVLSLAGCKSSKPLLPSVSGKAGEVVVVMEKADWEGTLGEEVRAVLAMDCPYLAQKEPLYSLFSVVPSNFGDMFKVHRNVLIFNVNSKLDSSAVIYRQDVWSSPQCVIQVSAPNSDEALVTFLGNDERIISTLEQAERDRVIRNSLLYEERSLFNKVSERFGGSPHFPSGYVLKKATSDFVWIANDTQSIYQDVLVYRYPATDNPFELKNIIAARNEVMMVNIPGMFDNTYMSTSEYFEPQLSYIKYRGREFAQTRGMWEVKNDFMGGPFTSHSFYSPDGQWIIVTEAFVYAPKYDKRQYLRQVESILFSWEWVK